MTEPRAARWLRAHESPRGHGPVREAAVAGLSIARIQQITGLAVTTFMRILNSHPGRRRTP